MTNPERIGATDEAPDAGSEWQPAVGEPATEHEERQLQAAERHYARVWRIMSPRQRARCRAEAAWLARALSRDRRRRRRQARLRRKSLPVRRRTTARPRERRPHHPALPRHRERLRRLRATA